MDTSKDLDLSVITPLLKRNNVSLDDFMSRLLAFRDAVQPATSAEAVPAPYLSGAEVTAFDKLQTLQKNPKWPDTAREATEDERVWIGEVREQVRILEDAFNRQKEEIKAAAHIHFDRVAEREGRVTEETLKNKDGHYCIEDKSSWAVPGESATLHRQVQSGSVSYGKTVISGDEWLRLFEEGVIDRKTYLRYTYPIRALDTDKILLDAKKNPELFRLVAQITKAGKPVAKIVASKVKD